MSGATASRLQYCGDNVAFAFAFNTADSIRTVPQGSKEDFVSLFGDELATTIGGLSWDDRLLKELEVPLPIPTV